MSTAGPKLAPTSVACDHDFCTEYDLRDPKGRRLCGDDLHALVFLGKPSGGAWRIGAYGTHQLFSEHSVSVDMNEVEAVMANDGFEDALEEFSEQLGRIFLEKVL